MLNKNKKRTVVDFQFSPNKKGWKSWWAYLLTTALSVSMCLPLSQAAGTETFWTNGNVLATSYAYSESVGFVDLNICDADDANGTCVIGDGVEIQASDMLHLVKVYDGSSGFYYLLRGYAWTEVAGWLKFGDVNSITPYANTEASNYGVNLLADGVDKVLDGYAWSERAGWIFFNSTGVLKDAANQDETNYGVYVEVDGDVKGYAFSESLGWFDLGTSLPVTLDFASLQIDTDGDGLSDEIELANGMDPNEPGDGSLDNDGDGVSNKDEILAGTNASDPDTDDDGLNDGLEIALGTDPTNPDTDGDGFTDGHEVNAGTDPKDNGDTPSAVVNPTGDDDGDGLTNQEEANYGTDPNNADSDGDGISDKEEVDNGLDPLDGSDAGRDNDGDGLSNKDEVAAGTDPNDNDSDDDGLFDGDEVAIGTDPLDDDSDNDGFKDGHEVNAGTDPNDNGDTPPAVVDPTGDDDSDGLTNQEEANYGTDKDNPDTDGDGITDKMEILKGLNPLDSTDAGKDSDGDGLNNLEEIAQGTNPYNPDTDNDGIYDGQEVLIGTNPVIADTDGDGYTDGEEMHNEPWTDPNTWADPNNNTDTPGDHVNGFVPDPTGDDDNDGLTNQEEENYGTDKNNADTDGDGISDKQEVVNGMDPLNPYDADFDNDGDGLSNEYEISLGTNPHDPDTDGDGLYDGQELEIGTDPLNRDTDGDGYVDGHEYYGGSNPLVDDGAPTAVTNPTGDDDNDGVLNQIEANYGTDKDLADTDGDGISDKDEIVNGLDPRDADDATADNDNDGLTNAEEIALGTNINDPDSDNDGLTDKEENDLGTNPLDPDSDDDGYFDGHEVNAGKDPLADDGDYPTPVVDPSKDSDGDGLTDQEEANYGTNPNSSDSDGDGVSDLLEIMQGSDPNSSDDHINISGAIVTLGSDAVVDGSDKNGQVMAITGTAQYMISGNDTGAIKNASGAVVVMAKYDRSWLYNNRTCVTDSNCLAVADIDAFGNFSLDVSKDVEYLIITSNYYDKKIVDVSGTTTDLVLSGDDVKLHLIGDFAATGKGKDQNYVGGEIVELVEYIEMTPEGPAYCYRGENIQSAIDAVCAPGASQAGDTQYRYKSIADGVLGESDGQRLYYYISRNTTPEMNPYTIDSIENSEWAMDFASTGEGKVSSDVVDLVDYILGDGTQCYKGEAVSDDVILEECWTTNPADFLIIDTQAGKRYKTSSDGNVNDSDGERLYYHISHSTDPVMNDLPADIFFKRGLPLGKSRWND